MSRSGGQVRNKSRYNEDGLRVGREMSHYDKISEKHLRSALHAKAFDFGYDGDDEEDEPYGH